MLTICTAFVALWRISEDSSTEEWITSAFFFTPRPNGMFFHKNVLNKALNLDLIWFCKDMIERVRQGRTEL